MRAGQSHIEETTAAKIAVTTLLLFFQAVFSPL